MIIEFYLVNIGFRIYEALDQILYRWHEVDLVEKLLHHWLTIVLLLSSYTTNFFDIGSPVLALHDFSDIFVGLSRFGIELMGSIGQMTLGLTFLATWIWFRIYFFGLFVLPAFYESAFATANPLVIKTFWPIFSYLCGL